MTAGCGCCRDKAVQFLAREITRGPFYWYSLAMITIEDFEKVDIRVGNIVDVQDFPEARKPAYKLKIDFGPELGIKQSSVQAPGAHTKEELLGTLVCCVVNFPSRRVGPFDSEVLTLGFENAAGTGWVLIEPKKDSVRLGSKLQ
jgi:tRNA-binding protein